MSQSTLSEIPPDYYKAADGFISQPVFAVLSKCPQHTFSVLSNTNTNTQKTFSYINTFTFSSSNKAFFSLIFLVTFNKCSLEISFTCCLESARAQQGRVVNRKLH